MNLSGVSSVILNDWIVSLIDQSSNERSNLLTIMLMTDATKITSLGAYLTIRSASNTAALAGLSDQMTAQAAAIASDNIDIAAALVVIA